jgi:hypothetical protein
VERARGAKGNYWSLDGEVKGMLSPLRGLNKNQDAKNQRRNKNQDPKLCFLDLKPLELGL